MSKADLESIMRDFKNLNSRVNNDNKKLKEELKKKDMLLASCQKEYQKVYYKCENLELQLHDAKQEIDQLRQNQRKQINRSRIVYPALKKRKRKRKYYIEEDESDDNDDDDEIIVDDENDESDENNIEEDNENKKIKRKVNFAKKKKTDQKQQKNNVKKKKTQKGIIDYINS